MYLKDCGKNCKNRWAEKLNSEKFLELFQPPNEKIGCGVRAKVDIKKGEYIAEYLAELIPENI